jgi:hypothetical protein
MRANCRRGWPLQREARRQPYLAIFARFYCGIIRSDLDELDQQAKLEPPTPPGRIRVGLVSLTFAYLVHPPQLLSFNFGNLATLGSGARHGWSYVVIRSGSVYYWARRKATYAPRPNDSSNFSFSDSCFNGFIKLVTFLLDEVGCNFRCETPPSEKSNEMGFVGATILIIIFLYLRRSL